MEELITKISQLGNELVNCNLNCSGISNNIQNGILPRCLYLETNNRYETNGCVVVGINPGRGSNFERDYYLNNGTSYQTILNFWNQHGRNHLYYRYLTDFVNLAGYRGPILWTELAKCESNTNTAIPPLQTFRTCTNNFLRRELESVPNDWPLIAIGRETYSAISYLYPTKSVLGLPHPTSSRGFFNRLFSNNSRQEFVVQIQNELNNFQNNNGLTIWLSI